MISFPLTLFRLDTGEIVSSPYIGCSEDAKTLMIDANLAIWGRETHGVIEVESDARTNFVVTLDDLPTIADRPALFVNIDRTEIELGEFATLTGMPDPCRIVIDAADPTVETQTHDIEGGGFEFEPESPGTYTIEVNRFPFLPWKAEVTAT